MGITLLFFLLTRAMKAAFLSNKFTRGMAGDHSVEIPGSSFALHAQLVSAAESHMQSEQRSEYHAVTILVASSRYDEAMETIDRALRSDPHRDYRVLLLWAKSNVCARAGETEEEIATLELLSTLLRNRMFEMNLGNAYAKTGDYAAAETRFLNAISLANGEYPLATYNLGCLYCRMKRKDDACRQLQALEHSAEDIPSGLMNRLRLRISELG